MGYTCGGKGNCEQELHDGCEYHDARIQSAAHDAIGYLSQVAYAISRSSIAGITPIWTELNRGADYEADFWREVEKRLEAESDRLKRLRQERNDLLEACERLIAVVGLTAFKHEGQRAVLQDAVDIASSVCAKARNGGEVALSSAIDRLRRQGDQLVASLGELMK